MSKVLETTGQKVISTDLFDRGFGERGIDFLSENRRSANIVTNPPFNSAEGFLKAALQKADAKVALLLRLAFLEGVKRRDTIFSRTPPTRIWVFSERITFYPAGVKPQGSGTTAYAWFVWEQGEIGLTEPRWLPVGYKAKHK